MRDVIWMVVGLCSFCIGGHAYDWGRYVPEEYKKYIPDEAHTDSEEADVYSDEPEVYYGPMRISQKKLQNLTVYGPLTITSSTVYEKTEVYGALTSQDTVFGTLFVKGAFQGTNVEFESADVYGPIHLERSTAHGVIDLKGTLKAKNSHLSDVEAYTDYIELIDTTADAILIKREWHSTKQIVVLKGRSKVRSITFESGNGKIQKDSRSTVGSISGAITS
jgi:hypothetical protein